MTVRLLFPRRRDVLGMLGVGSMAWASRGHAQAMMLEEPWTAGHLAGTFARPRTETPPGPGALIVAGSGPTPRDGNFGTYRQIAHGLAASGIRSLRYDKRGVGASKALVEREDDLVIEHFVDDALLAARDLAARSDVTSVFIIGHSEGALIATLVASKTPTAGIALLAGIGRRLDAVIREQLQAMPLQPSHEHLRRQAMDILERLARGERVKDVAIENAPLFRPSVQPFLISVFAIDPAAEIARLKLPTLLVRGASDIQVSAVDLDLLARARPDARALVIPECNHVFKQAPADIGDRQAQLKSYDPSAPLVSGLVPALTEFIRSVKQK